MCSLDIVTCCLDLLAVTPGQLPGEQQEHILPLVHDVWQPLKLVFKSSNIFLVEKGFDCLLVIAKHARDFVHRRTVADVFPPLLKFFQTLEVSECEARKPVGVAVLPAGNVIIDL